MNNGEKRQLIYISQANQKVAEPKTYVTYAEYSYAYVFLNQNELTTIFVLVIYNKILVQDQ